MWVKKGLIRVWDGPPIDPVELQDLCREERDDLIVDGLMGVLAKNLRHYHPPAPSLGVLCHCGCLLRHPLESCPNCLVWAIADEARHSWEAAQEFYHPTQSIAEELAA